MKKKILAGVVGMLAVASLTGCGKNSDGENGGLGGAGKDFEYLIDQGVSTEYYLTYADNPVMKYVREFKTFEDSEGNQSHINVSFLEPAAGKAADNLSTLISTGSYPDIMSMTYYGGSIADLYEAGSILDLEPYINEYMPNYKAWLEKCPEVDATTRVNGESKYLTLVGIKGNITNYDMFAGWCYRRDWIVKYGVQPEEFFDPMKDTAPRKNEKAGQAFSGYYSLDKEGNAIQSPEYVENVNGDSWVDDVVFPSGNTDPVYISDWEWMMGIFAEALEKEGIANGYVMSLYYPGYNANGDLVSSFGGNGPLYWYDEKANEVKFGANTENFKVYLQCLNNWWEKGWIDSQFAERSGDMFYRIDEVSFRSGKVGLWCGAPSNFGSRLYQEEQTYTKGIVVWGAANPINDIYGGKEQQLVIPKTFYYPTKSGGGIVVTDKAKDKDLALLFHYLDYFYSEEGSLLINFGLNAEQQAEAQDKTYIKYGLENGAYEMVEKDGEKMVKYAPLMQTNDGNIRVAMNGGKHFGLGMPLNVDYGDTKTYVNSLEQWNRYEATGFMAAYSFNYHLDAEQQQKVAKINSRIETEYLYINVPQFIKGKKNFEKDWETFCKDLTKRDFQYVLDAYAEVVPKK